MPALDGSISFARFYVEGDAPSGKQLQASLCGHAFKPLRADEGEDRAEGWVELEDPDQTAFAPERMLFDGVLIIRHRTDRLQVPAPLLKRRLEEWARAYTRDNGRPPPRGVKKEQKELLHQQLRRQAFPQSKTVDISWRLDTGELWIWATSRKQIDELIAQLEDTFGLHLSPRGPEALTALALGPDDALVPTAALFGTELSRAQR